MMIKQYENYTPSKFKWIEQIPNHWNEGKIAYYFEIGRGRVISELELNPDGLYPVYSSQTKNDGCLGLIDTYDFDKDMLTWTTDGANAGTVFIRTGKFNCTNVCGTLVPKVEVNLKYYLYYLQNITPFYKRPDTNGAKIMNNEMARIYCLIPPLEEQTKIAQYLDHQTAIIDQLIQQKEKLIGLLKEKRQSFINEAVTKGLNPDAKMKNTGIEWLGEVPEEWEVKKLKHLLEDCEYSLKTGPFGSQLKASDTIENGEFVVYNQRNVLDNQFSEFKDTVSKEKFDSLAGFEVLENDILITTRGTIGKAALVSNLLSRGILHPCLIKVRVNIGEILREWLLMYINNSSYFLENVKLESNSTTIEVIYGGTLSNIIIPVPPIEDQGRILIELTKIEEKYSDLIQGNLDAITLLKEYRQSIIFEAVTGKIDVRDWQLNKQHVA